MLKTTTQAPPSLVFKDTDEARVKELIPTLPMYKYFDSVIYSLTEMQF